MDHEVRFISLVSGASSSVQSVIGPSQILRDGAELFQCRLQVLDDRGGEDVGLREVSGLFQRFVADPEDVEVGLVTGHRLVVGEGLPASVGVVLGPCLGSLIAVLGVVAGDEVVQIFAGERVLLEREVLVGAQIVDPGVSVAASAPPARRSKTCSASILKSR